MKIAFGFFLIVILYVSFYFSLTVSNVWILLSIFSIVHIGLFQAYREILNPKIYFFCSILHIASILAMNLYFKQTLEV
ncbi:hypothetical protein AB3N59_17065 [Leptospira sp. WS92.C1]